jgi:hypothetical protein
MGLSVGSFIFRSFVCILRAMGMSMYAMDCYITYMIPCSADALSAKLVEHCMYVFTIFGTLGLSASTCAVKLISKISRNRYTIY